MFESSCQTTDVVSSGRARKGNGEVAARNVASRRWPTPQGTNRTAGAVYGGRATARFLPLSALRSPLPSLYLTQDTQDTKQHHIQPASTDAGVIPWKEAYLVHARKEARIGGRGGRQHTTQITARRCGAKRDGRVGVLRDKGKQAAMRAREDHQRWHGARRDTKATGSGRDEGGAHDGGVVGLCAVWCAVLGWCGWGCGVSCAVVHGYRQRFGG